MIAEKRTFFLHFLFFLTVAIHCKLCQVCFRLGTACLYFRRASAASP